MTTGSNYSVVSAAITAPAGTPTVPISTPYPDVNGNTVPAHLITFAVGNVATPVSASQPLPVTGIVEVSAGPGVTISSSYPALSANINLQVLAANPTRKSLKFIITGSGLVYIGWGVAAVVGTGVAYGATGLAIGAFFGAGDGVPTQALNMICSVGTTVAIEEGN